MTVENNAYENIHDKIDRIYSENPVKRFNLGFGIIGVPEQNKDGKYCEYLEAMQIPTELLSLLLTEENKIWEFEAFKIPMLKAHYRHRIAVAVFVLFPLGYFFGRVVTTMTGH